MTYASLTLHLFVLVITQKTLLQYFQQVVVWCMNEQLDEISLVLYVMFARHFVFMRENFGRQGRHLVKLLDFAGVEKIGAILNSTHSFVEVILEAGFHSTSIVVVSIGPSFGKFDRPSSPYRIVYDKPRLDMIVFGKDLRSTTMSNTFDAQGMSKTNKTLID